MDNFVSIIMPNYNTPIKFLKKSIESVQAQTYENWELLITDDGSNIENIGTIKEYTNKDSRIKLLKNKFEKGPAGARNTSLEEAKGRFIAFLDSDDQWLTFHLSERIEQMITNDYGFTHSWFDMVDDHGRACWHRRYKKERTSYKNLLLENNIGCLTAIYDVRKFGKFYSPNLPKSQDFALWLNLLKKIDYAYLYPKTTAIYIKRQGSITKTNRFNFIKYRWIIYRNLENFGFFKTVFYLFIFLFNHIKRKVIKEYKEMRGAI